jgi:hypothetical protein
MEYCMNPYDLNNLSYIMSLNNEQFDEWMLSISDDDVNYAIEIIQARRAELIEKEHDLIEDMLDVTEAQSILSKFTLKG